MSCQKKIMLGGVLATVYIPIIPAICVKIIDFGATVNKYVENCYVENWTKT